MPLQGLDDKKTTIVIYANTGSHSNTGYSSNAESRDDAHIIAAIQRDAEIKIGQLITAIYHGINGFKQQLEHHEAKATKD